ncbi:hypothetical protein KY290_003774 [Solanum tuberosum]|uniref:Uncharacterized protein n=1 Tax=Solanum tuberosum TaxID=4113 RepID=A0ABQ7WTW3_SOLTU|nr:hypothetical protein KY289_000672 [Solanum tuberosum]KAH0784176.1 hypothetical protein KY290_003774 [Solanum tuberosum]
MNSNLPVTMLFTYFPCDKEAVKLDFDWPTSLARCAHAMSDACKPWLMPPDVGRRRLPDAHMPRPMRAGLGRCCLAPDVERPCCLRRPTCPLASYLALESHPTSRKTSYSDIGEGGGGDESERQRAESQWIVAARPLCHLQYPVAYLSHLQRILPAARWKLYFKAVTATLPSRRLSQRHVPLGAKGPYCGSKGSLGHAFTMCRPSQTPHLTMSSARIGPRSEPWVQKEGQCPASDSRNNRIPLVRTSSELAVRRLGKAPEGTVPSPSPGRHAATHSRRGSSSSSPPTADGFGTGTPVPSPQSQSFSRSYGSILPTSLAYIVPSTRGCSPWRPDAVMSTIGRGRHSVLRIFKGRRERTGHHATCGALPAAGPYLRLSRFQGGQAVKQKR